MTETVIRRADGGVVRRKARAGSFTLAKQARFLNVLAETANVRAAAREAGVGRNLPYRQRAADPEFRARWDAALVHAWDELERTLLQFSLNGYSKVLTHAGRIGDTVHDKDTKLMLALYRTHASRVAAVRPGGGAPASLPDYATSRRLMEDKLSLMAERLAQPLPPGLAAHESAPAEPDDDPDAEREPGA